MSDKGKHIRWFEKTTIDDVPLMGEKSASLEETYRELTSKSIRIINNFRGEI